MPNTDRFESKHFLKVALLKRMCYLYRFTSVDKRNQNIVRTQLESPYENEEAAEPTASAETKAKKFYKSCLTPDLEKQNLHALLSVIKYLGGWSLTGNGKSFFFV